MINPDLLPVHRRPHRRDDRGGSLPPGGMASTSVVQPVLGVPWAASQPGPCIAEDTIVVQVAAAPGVLPLEGLEPAAAEAIGEGGRQPLLGRREPGDQAGKAREFGLSTMAGLCMCGSSPVLSGSLHPVWVLGSRQQALMPDHPSDGRCHQEFILVAARLASDLLRRTEPGLAGRPGLVRRQIRLVGGGA
jgi:hypothetical protein